MSSGRTRGSTFTPVGVTGDDVVLDMGCSPQWAGWVVNAYKECRDGGGEVIEGEILLMEGNGWGIITAARDTFVDQLDGAEPVRLLEDDGAYRYTLGFDEDHARDLIDDWNTALRFGVHEHQMNIRFHISTLEGLVGQLKAQVNDAE